MSDKKEEKQLLELCVVADMLDSDDFCLHSNRVST